MVLTLQAAFALLLFTCAINLLLSVGKSEGNSIDQKSYTENGQCVKVLSVKANGISDSFNISCTNNDLNLISSDSYMVVGDPQENNFTLYSDAPNTLVVVENGECTKKTYTTTASSSTSSSEAMSDDECTTVKNKMTEIIKKNKQYWLYWNKNFTAFIGNMFPPGFPFNNGNKDSSSQTGSKDSSTPWWNNLWG